MPEVSFATAYAPFAEEVARLLPPGDTVLDAHTHLGADEDGRSLTPPALMRALDEVGPETRGCAFAFHDPDRAPAYRKPNDRVLDWARESGGRILPYARLDPADDPIGEGQRCLARGARGIKLHPLAQSFGFGAPVMEAIFGLARDASVPIIVHAGRGMPPMDELADVALRHPEVTLVLAHAATAGQGMFASRLAEHPAVLYDTACLFPFDAVELFARVPAERVVFGSDVPYGHPVAGLFQTLRAALLAGLTAEECRLITGVTMTAALEGTPLPEPRSPRLSSVRPLSGPLVRAAMHLTMALGSGSQGGPDVARMGPGIALARCVCRDPDAGTAGEALERIDAALAAAERLIADGGPGAWAAISLVHGAAAIAATEPVAPTAERPPD